MSDENEGQWLSINEPPSRSLTTRQEIAIRAYVKAVTGRDDLRGFNKTLEKWGWDYYDVLHEVSP